MRKTMAMLLAVVVTSTGWTVWAQEAKPPAAKPKAAAPATKPAKPVPPAPTYSGKNPKTLNATAGTPDNTPPAGFVAAFNGKALTGWRGLLKGPNDNPFKRAALSPEDRAKAQAEA